MQFSLVFDDITIGRGTTFKSKSKLLFIDTSKYQNGMRIQFFNDISEYLHSWSRTTNEKKYILTIPL